MKNNNDFTKNVIKKSITNPKTAKNALILICVLIISAASIKIASETMMGSKLVAFFEIVNFVIIIAAIKTAISDFVWLYKKSFISTFLQTITKELIKTKDTTGEYKDFIILKDSELLSDFMIGKRYDSIIVRSIEPKDKNELFSFLGEFSWKNDTLKEADKTLYPTQMLVLGYKEIEEEQKRKIIIITERIRGKLKW